MRNQKMSSYIQKYKEPSRHNQFPDWIKTDLGKSGLDYADIHVMPLRNEEELNDNLGYLTMHDERIIDVGGYWIPYPNVHGYKRLRLKRKIGDAKYLSPSNAGNHPYITQSVLEIAKKYKPDIPLYITEGEKKTVKATLEGFPCIGLSGVWCFKDKEHVFLPELEELNFKHRKCYICFDSDTKHKLPIRHAELRLTVELMNRGAQVYVVRMPDQDDGKKNGLDDYLVKYGRDKFIELTKHAEEL